jgi:hypothetical protein
MFTRAIDSATLDHCDYSVHPVNPATLSFVELFAYYERLRGYVQHEDGLINSRLTWSLTIHGFLFAIYGLLASKAVDVMSSAKPLVDAVYGLLIVQIIAAGIGTLVGYYSREAIVASHNALQHLFTIATAEGVLQIPTPSTTSPAAIPLDAQPQAVTPASMAGITQGSRVMVENEIVQVTTADNISFTASFAEAHAAGSRIRPLRQLFAQAGPNATILRLPKIIGGGAAGKHTGGASSYYVLLPAFLMVAWILLGVLSAIFLWEIHHHAPVPPSMSGPFPYL